MRAVYAAVVAGVFSCTGGGIIALCGGLQQPCCADGVCTQNSTQCVQNRCEACGATDQRCCLGDTCNDGLTCAETCQPPQITCSTSCTVGTSRCSGNTVESCVVSGGCPSWQHVSCSPRSSCVAGSESASCVDPCPGGCRSGALLCSPDGLQLCAQAAQCPVLVPQPDTALTPQCLSAAAVNDSLRWEGPSPLGAPLVGLHADRVEQAWLLDGLGNIIRRNDTRFTYEVRAEASEQVRGLVSCGVPGRLLAFGTNGLVLRRQGAFGEWAVERVGTAALIAAACQTFGPSFAVTERGVLFEKPDGQPWAPVVTGTVGPITAMAHDSNDNEVLLLGRGGLAVRCTMRSGQRGCQAEATGIAFDFTAARFEAATNSVVAVGTNGLVARRTTNGWQTLPTNTSATFRAVGGVPDVASALTAVGDGVIFTVPPRSATWSSRQRARRLFSGRQRRQRH